MKESKPIVLPKLGRWILAQRKSASLTLAVLSKKVGLEGSSALLKYEQGRISTPTPEVLKKIAKACGGNYLEGILILLQEKYGLSKREILSFPEMFEVMKERGELEHKMKVVSSKIARVGK